MGLAVVRITAQLSNVPTFPSSPDTLICQAQGTPGPAQPGCEEGLRRKPSCHGDMWAVLTPGTRVSRLGYSFGKRLLSFLQLCADQGGNASG